MNKVIEGAISPKIEQWRDIPGCEGRYQISSFGRAKRLAQSVKDSRGGIRLLKEQPVALSEKWRQGMLQYQYVQISGVTNHVIHRLVANAFLPNPDNKPFVLHRDGNLRNNNVENLYWSASKDVHRHWDRKLERQQDRYPDVQMFPDL